MRVKPVLLYGKQRSFRRSSAWCKGFVGGRGSGKSLIGALDVMMRAKRGEPWMSVSPNYTVIQDTTWPTFEECARKLGLWVRGRQHPTPKAWFRTLDGGIANIVFRSGEKPDMLRGPSKAGLWIDEASVTHPDVLKFAIPVLRYKGKMGPCLLTFTPKGKRHWTFEVFYERIEEDRQVEFESNGDGTQYALVEDPITGECVKREVTEFGGVPFLRKPTAELFHAHTLENPFLPPEFHDNIRGHYSAALAAQELGGEFVELQGLMFMREWFVSNMVEAVPREALRVRYWDRAATEGSGSYSSGTLMAMDRIGQFYVEDVVRGQWSALRRDQVIVETARRDAELYGNEVVIYVEQEGGSGGKEVAQQMVMMLAGFPVYRDLVSGKRHKMKDKMVLPGEAKIVRAMPLNAQCEAGNVFVRRARWNENWFEELAAFPEYAFSDQVDATSGAFNKLAAMGRLDPGNIHRTNLEGMESAERFGVQLIRSRQRRARFRANGQ